jgi:type I restriction enzyme R subunit
LAGAGWLVCDAGNANIHGARGVAIREFPLPGHGHADYLLYVDGKAAGVIEAKKGERREKEPRTPAQGCAGRASSGAGLRSEEGATLTGVETQSAKYTKGLPAGLPRWASPLPFSYQSTGTETRFTNGLDPAPRSRPVFAFHKPETLAEFLEDFLKVGRVKERSDKPANAAAEAAATYDTGRQAAPAGPSARGIGASMHGTFLARLQHMPALKTEMGERRVKEPRTPAHACAGRTTSAAGLRSEVTGSVISMVKIAVPLIVQSHETLAA